MGKRGPAKKPQALIEFEGNRGHRSKQHMQAGSAKAPVGLPAPPDWLYPEAVTEWYNLGDHLTRMGVVTVVDWMAFAVLCQAFGRWARAEWDLKDQPQIVPGSKGNLTLNPQYQIIRQAVDDIKRMLPQFGLTPASRYDVAIAGEDPEEKEKWSLFERTRAGTQRRQKPDE